MDVDCEIEYLDEDEEIVQSCIETMKSTDIEQQISETINRQPKKLGKPRILSTPAKKIRASIQPIIDNKFYQKRKHTDQHDEDSDYQPNLESDDSDFEIGKPEFPNRAKKRKQVTKAMPQIAKRIPLTFKLQTQFRTPQAKPGYIPKPEVVYLPPPPVPRVAPASKNVAKQSNIIRIIANTNKQKVNRPQLDPKKFAQKLKMNPNISIKKIGGSKTTNKNKILVRDLSSVELKDYKDPLTHRGPKVTFQDSAKKQWNEMCRAHAQKIQRTPAKSSKTVQTIRKLEKKGSDQVTKLCLETRVDGKLERLLVVLPKLETLDSYSVSFKDNGKNVSFGFKSCMLLTMETSKHFEGLVAYNPKQQRITTYKEIKCQNGTGKVNGKNVEARMQMLMTCRMCVACYQYSWRGGKNNKPSSDMRCAICDGIFTSAYNLLSHLRSHELTPLQKRRQNALLAKIMPYHYICRICKFQTDCIPNLRRHINKHRGNEPFTCIVGNHIAT